MSLSGGYCPGAGDLSVWEFSGNECYYVCYDQFIGDPNCIHCVLFRLSDPPDVRQQQIHFWLNFVRTRIAPTEPIGMYCSMSSTVSLSNYFVILGMGNRVVGTWKKGKTERKGLRTIGFVGAP